MTRPAASPCTSAAQTSSRRGGERRLVVAGGGCGRRSLTPPAVFGTGERTGCLPSRFQSTRSCTAAGRTGGRPGRPPSCSCSSDRRTSTRALPSPPSARAGLVVCLTGWRWIAPPQVLPLPASGRAVRLVLGAASLLRDGHVRRQDLQVDQPGQLAPRAGHLPSLHMHMHSLAAFLSASPRLPMSAAGRLHPAFSSCLPAAPHVLLLFAFIPRPSFCQPPGTSRPPPSHPLPAPSSSTPS